MTSPRKRYTNRINALASTGPKTAAGKARSAQNARRHGLSLPALHDPSRAAEITALARALTGNEADVLRLAHARRITAAQIDVLRVRHARRQLIAKLTSDTDVLARIARLERYERDARHGTTCKCRCSQLTIVFGLFSKTKPTSENFVE